MPTIHYSEDPKLRTAQRVVFWVVIGLGGLALFGVLFGLIVQLLWNATVTPLFSLPAISFWQAVGVFILAKIIFGFGASSGSGSRSKSRSGGKSGSKRGLRFEARLDSDEATEPDDEAFDDPRDDEDFRRFWREEGQAAYDRYRRGDTEGAE